VKEVFPATPLSSLETQSTLSQQHMQALSIRETAVVMVHPRINGHAAHKNKWIARSEEVFNDDLSTFTVRTDLLEILHWLKGSNSNLKRRGWQTESIYPSISNSSDDCEQTKEHHGGR
jgi:hypothetical protein